MSNWRSWPGGWPEFEAFVQRDLSGLDVVYLFADAIYESLRRQAGCP